MSTVVTGHKGYSDREGAMRSQWDGRRKCNWIAVVKVKHPINIGFASRSEFIVDRSDGPTRARLDHLSQEPVVRVFLTAVTRFAASGISTSLRSLPHLVSSWLVGPESGVPILAWVSSWAVHFPPGLASWIRPWGYFLPPAMPFACCFA